MKCKINPLSDKLLLFHLGSGFFNNNNKRNPVLVHVHETSKNFPTIIMVYLSQSCTIIQFLYKQTNDTNSFSFKLSRPMWLDLKYYLQRLSNNWFHWTQYSLLFNESENYNSTHSQKNTRINHRVRKCLNLYQYLCIFISTYICAQL